MTNYDISNFSEKEMEEFLQHLRPVAYSSKLLSDTETRYANIEHNLLGVVCGIEHFKYFMFRRKTHIIITDHKPYFHFQKSITNTTPRLSRLLQRVSNSMCSYTINQDLG